MSDRTVTKEEDGLMGLDDWERLWKEGETDWQGDEAKISALLTAKADVLFLQKHCRVFVPLCGKAPELMLLYKNGHTVIGNEFAESPVRELFDENNIKFSVEKLNNIECKKFSSEDGRLIIYQGDLFLLTEEVLGKFDVIWDCGSFVAINLDDRASYMNLMWSVMKQDSRYLLSTLEYDPAVWPGPPHNTDENSVKELFGDRCTFELVSTTGKDAIMKTLEKNDHKQGESTPQAKPKTVPEAFAISSYLYIKVYILLLK